MVEHTTVPVRCKQSQDEHCGKGQNKFWRKFQPYEGTIYSKNFLFSSYLLCSLELHMQQLKLAIFEDMVDMEAMVAMAMEVMAMESGQLMLMLSLDT